MSVEYSTVEGLSIQQKQLRSLPNLIQVSGYPRQFNIPFIA
jgi:hypothetical protein